MYRSTMTVNAVEPVSYTHLVADIPGQHFLVGETGGDAFGVGYVAAAIVAYVNDKSAARGKIGEYLIQVSVAYVVPSHSVRSVI